MMRISEYCFQDNQIAKMVIMNSEREPKFSIRSRLFDNLAGYNVIKFLKFLKMNQWCFVMNKPFFDPSKSSGNGSKSIFGLVKVLFWSQTLPLISNLQPLSPFTIIRDAYIRSSQPLRHHFSFRLESKTWKKKKILRLKIFEKSERSARI